MQEEIGHMSGSESTKRIEILVKNFPSKETLSSNGFMGEFWQNLYLNFFFLKVSVPTNTSVGSISKNIFNILEPKKIDFQVYNVL